MKTPQRIATLRTILEKYRPSTQQEILELLLIAGVETNQATVCRDLKRLNIGKNDGVYVLPATLDEKSTNLIQSATPAGDSLIVVKTTSGAANAAAAHIDKLNFPSIIGTIAGDDTIFIATSSQTAQKKTITYIIGLMK